MSNEYEALLKDLRENPPTDEASRLKVIERINQALARLQVQSTANLNTAIAQFNSELGTQKND